MAERRKFLFSLDQLVSYCEECKPAFGSSAVELRVDEEELERRWGNLTTNYEVLMTADEGEHKEDLLGMAKKKYVAACEQYRNCNKKIQ